MAVAELPDDPERDLRTLLRQLNAPTLGNELLDRIVARVRAEAIGAAAGPVSVGAVRDAAAAMVRWCDDPTASPTVLGSILAPLVPAVRAEAVAEIVEAIREVLPDALGHNSLPDIVRGIGRQRDGQHEMKDHLVDVARRLTDERDRAVAEAVAERDAHWMQRLTDLQEEYGRIEEARERRLVRAVADERQRIEKVRELHPPTSNDNGERVCATCVNLGEHDSWPCATLLALAAGSVPVATPEPTDPQCSGCSHGRSVHHARDELRWNCLVNMCDCPAFAPAGPVATPTGPAEHCTFEEREDCPRHGPSASPVPAEQPSSAPESWGDLAADVMGLVDQTLDGEPPVPAGLEAGDG